MMKKTFAFLLILSLSFISLVACTVNPAKTPDTHNSVVLKTTDMNSYVKPAKTVFTEEEQKIVDFYYPEMIQKFPSFKEIPREMLKEYIIRDEYLTVGFVFCLGGIGTDCKCSFATSQEYPDENWTVNENEFSKYYKSGLSEEQMNEIRTLLGKGICDYINDNKLEKNDSIEEKINFCWQTSDGNIYASTEYIADVTLFTTKKYGCGDHAHIFGKVPVDISSDKVTLTACQVTGG